MTDGSEGAGTAESWAPGAWRHPRSLTSALRLSPAPHFPPSLLAARPPNGEAGTARSCSSPVASAGRLISFARLASVAVTGRGGAGRDARPTAARPRLPEATASRDDVPSGGDKAAPRGGEARRGGRG